MEKLPLPKVSSDRDTFDIESLLFNYFRTRVSPRFHFTPGEKDCIIERIPEQEKLQTIHMANKICENIFNFRGVGDFQFEGDIDWNYTPNGNPTWTKDLNRHHFFVTLGLAYAYTNDEKYVQRFIWLMEDWIKKNPVNYKNSGNWKSPFEVGVRINTWLWAFYLFLGSDLFKDAHFTLLKGLFEHCRYLNTRLEIHAPTNHLLLEAKALALFGFLFPEFKKSKKWRKTGFRTLYNQIQQQVHSDGVHGELSTGYHKVITSELLEIFVLAENNSFEIPEMIKERFQKMLDFEFHMTKPDGTFPLFGDSALNNNSVRFCPLWGGMILFNRPEFRNAVSQPNQLTLWLLGKQRMDSFESILPSGQKPMSSLFQIGGYAFFRDGWDKNAHYLAFDCGEFGYKHSPGHGHSDALSFEFSAYGQSFIV
ncbi:MAG: heparinase II/III family protein, partial [bacterium]